MNLIALIIIAIAVLIIISISVLYKRKKLIKEVQQIDCPNILKDLDALLPNFINDNEKEELRTQHLDSYNQLNKEDRLSSILGVSKREDIKRFLTDYRQLDELVKAHNNFVFNQILEKNKDFFDHCLKYPLDEQQRRAIISEEDNVLVVSSAGSGKTSSIVGKVKYLTEIKKVDPTRILLISYTNKAATELTERMGIAGMRGYTFHKLAIDTIAETTGIKPSICDNTDKVYVKVYHELLKDNKFRNNVMEYFLDYDIEESDEEKMQNAQREQLIEQKSKQLKAMFPDMDGQAIYVRSEQEKKICFALSTLGLKIKYEENYEYPLADQYHSQYRPDFTIHYKEGDTEKRAYLEHYGTDEHGMVPEWFAKDKGISYEEANQRYNDGISWKRAAHKKFNTKLIETRSADFTYFDIRDHLKKKLEEAGIPFREVPEEELFDLILPKNSKQEQAFIRLLVTFITLMRSSYRSLSEIANKASKEGDKRSKFIIEKLIRPVYEGYLEEMKNNHQVDFTDIILQATQIYQTSHPEQYEYIIVDEFQDISIDRYKFLLALREGATKAKLFCVGDDWQSIYRFSGSDMSLFGKFESYFGPTDIRRIETTYRFGQPLVSISSAFIQKNPLQLKKNIHPFNVNLQTNLSFQPYEKSRYAETIEYLVSKIPADKSVFLLGRYSFDDIYISTVFKSIKKGDKFCYEINGREVEFLTAHKSKGLEADYVIVMQCNKGTYGFPSSISDDPVLTHVLSSDDKYPFGEERRLFYVAITRAKLGTIVMYDQKYPSVFVTEFLHPERLDAEYNPHRNANKHWGPKGDAYLLKLYKEGRTIKEIGQLMGRSYTSILFRLKKLGVDVGERNDDNKYRYV